MCGLSSPLIQRKLLATSFELADEQTKLFQPDLVSAIYSRNKGSFGSRNRGGAISTQVAMAGKSKCFRCGRAHDPLDWDCFSCGKRGHITAVCRVRNVHNIENEPAESVSEETDSFLEQDSCA